MTRQDIIEKATAFTEESEYNYVSEKIALSRNLIGMRMFDAPVLGFASPEDHYFSLLKQPHAIGEHFMLPTEWLPEANTVISLFLPFTQEVKNGNKKDMNWPTEEWLHARIEGQAFINKLSNYLKSELFNAGYNSMIPSLDSRFFSQEGTTTDSACTRQLFTSNWSERHIAFVCGLGTFGLSKGLITKKGVAGRFSSLITQLSIPTDKREYEDIYEYCNMCGKCVVNCPADAISIEKGKNHSICSDFINVTMEKYAPRYGCGKCQIKVPCENGIPVNHSRNKSTNT